MNIDPPMNNDDSTVINIGEPLDYVNLQGPVGA